MEADDSLNMQEFVGRVEPTPVELDGNEELTPDDVFIRTVRVTGLHPNDNGCIAVCENEDADIFMELAYRPNEIYPKVGDEMIVYAVHSDKPLIIYKDGQTVK